MRPICDSPSLRDVGEFQRLRLAACRGWHSSSCWRLRSAAATRIARFSRSCSGERPNLDAHPGTRSAVARRLSLTSKLAPSRAPRVGPSGSARASNVLFSLQVCAAQMLNWCCLRARTDDAVFISPSKPCRIVPCAAALCRHQDGTQMSPFQYQPTHARRLHTR